MKKHVCGYVFLTLAVQAFGMGNVEWGGREPHLAVVDPVCGYAEGTTLDLGGEWTFATCRFMADRSQFFNLRPFKESWPKERKINVPGTWESQGVGEPVPATRRCCYAGYEACFPLTHSFTGDGWYRRTFEIPAAWKGKRIWLKIGGVGCQGWFWVNDRPVAHVFDYCATRKFEITDLVEPGKAAKFVVEVSNAAPSKLGTAEAVSCFGGILRPLELEATPQTFIDDAWVRGDFDKREAELHVTIGGRDVGRAACPQAAERRVKDNALYQIRFIVDGHTVEQPIPQSSNPPILQSSNYTLHLPLHAFRPWSPEHPNLYTGVVELVENGVVVQTRRERFGIRKFEVRGKDFYLNGKPFFLRGCGFHEVDPIYGRHRPRREDCRARIAQARAAGFNFARLHTRCESPEFFEAADELGLMLQAELPYYGDFSTGMAPCEPLADARELWENFRRHPSFAVYSGGNEGTFGPVLGPKFYATVKAMDPDRLVIEQDTMAQPPWKRSPSEAKGAQVWRGAGVTDKKDLARYRVAGTDDFIAFPDRIWPRGQYDPPCPMIAHEFMNLSVKSDTRLEKDYTGIWDHPVKRAVRGEWLARFGLDHAMGDRLQDAQHQLQAIWQKRGVESARKDPHCDGYYFWSLTDCTMPNEPDWDGIDKTNLSYIAQGLFTPFLTEKIGGQTTEGFAAFNSPSCILLDTPKDSCMFMSGETVAVDFLFAHYGDATLRDAVLEWRLDISGRAACPQAAECARRVKDNAPYHGRVPLDDIAIGATRKVATVPIVFPEVDRFVRVTLAASLGGTKNRWDFWLFPKREKRDGHDIAAVGECRAAVVAAFDGVLPPERAAEAKVVVADRGSPEAAAALARGQSVVEIGGLKEPMNIELGWWFHKNIVGAVFDVKSPLLKYLPPSGNLSTLHFRLFKKGLEMPVKDFPASSLAAISEEQATCRAHLGERMTEKGGRHIFAYGLALDQPLPEAVAILDGLIDRAREP